MEILQITIEVAPGQIETVIVHDDDSPDKLASDFCREHNLNDIVKQIFV